jgi:hypothetical protein
MAGKAMKATKPPHVRKKRNDPIISFEVDGCVLELPRSAFEEGAYAISLSGGTYVETDDYVASVRAFLWALRERGLTSIQF